jgi:hypothetical protein
MTLKFHEFEIQPIHISSRIYSVTELYSLVLGCGPPFEIKIY